MEMGLQKEEEAVSGTGAGAEEAVEKGAEAGEEPKDAAAKRKEVEEKEKKEPPAAIPAELLVKHPLQHR